jgi:hypothetical protein
MVSNKKMLAPLLLLRAESSPQQNCIITARLACGRNSNHAVPSCTFVSLVANRRPRFRRGLATLLSRLAHPLCSLKHDADPVQIFGLNFSGRNPQMSQVL